MSKRVDKLAGRIATQMLAKSGVIKSRGAMASVMPAAVATACYIVETEKALKRAVRQVERERAEMGRLIDVNGARINALAERYAEYAGTAVPSAEKVHRGVVDMDLERFGVGLVEKQAPRKTNGRSSHGEGVDSQPAPLWHPESEN